MRYVGSFAKRGLQLSLQLYPLSFIFNRIYKQHKQIMKKIFITLISVFAALAGFSQSTDNAYGPVKTKELKETIGQNYVVIALDKQDAKRGYTTIKNIK